MIPTYMPILLIRDQQRTTINTFNFDFCALFNVYLFATLTHIHALDVYTCA